MTDGSPKRRGLCQLLLQTREVEPGLLGSDDSGSRYFQMAANYHGGRLFVEQPQVGCVLLPCHRCLMAMSPRCRAVR